jgi:hypothetical protein
MRKITLTKSERESDVMPRLGYNTLNISQLEGEGCIICFSNSSGSTRCIPIREPQTFNFSGLERDYRFPISHFQFKYLDKECRLFCDLE